MIYASNNSYFIKRSIGLFNSPVEFINESAVLNEYAIRIPKEYAREESTKRVRANEVENVPHYELRIERQVGTYKTHRDTYVFLKLPKSGRYVSIILYADGGANFDPKFHTWIIRELDELDRRIILGFCIKYDWALRVESHDDEYHKEWLLNSAATYKASDMPKRLKTGHMGNKLFPSSELTPIEENNLFSNIQLI